MSASPMDSSDCLLVVVIDIGTSESGIAYSFRNDYKKDPLKVTFSHWTDDHYIRETTPTCALFTKEKKFEAFGFDAESRYSEHVDENTHTDVYYFKRVIVDLFKNKVNGEFCLEDQTGKTMQSMDVLTACIQYLNDHLFDCFKKAHLKELNSFDILWVLPVPVSWNNKHMTFMRTAAVNAGLPDELIIILKESEAAFQYCSFQNHEINKSSVCHPPLQDRHFLLVNVNNFTVDITVHRASWTSHILEIYKQQVENFGNTPLEHLFADMFCSDVMNSYIDTNDFEYNIMKQGCSAQLEGIMPSTVRCWIPPSLLSHFESKRGIKFADHITACYGGGLIRADKLKIATKLLKPKLRDIYEHIVSTIQHTFETFYMIGISAIVSVGKCSEYPMLHDVIKEAFPDKQIIVPDNADRAVLGGAVLYGHQVLLGKAYSRSTENKLFSEH